MYFDTHVHFEPGDEIDAVLARAVAAGVERMVAVGGSADLNAGAIAAAERHPDRIGLAVGFDRDQAGSMAPADAVAHLGAAVAARAGGAAPVVALGEAGLDYHYHPESRPEQLALFGAQLALARELQLPIVVHSRAAEDDTIELLAEHVAEWPGAPDRIGVLHCFTGGPPFAERLAETGFYVSLSGIITFRNADSIRAAARIIPAERLVLETDSPLLAPVPHRGKRNEPAWITHVADIVATVRGVSQPEIAHLTRHNAETLFGLACQHKEG